MDQEKPEPMNLEKLKVDILSNEAESALPKNLSNFWLGVVGESLEQVFDYPDEQSQEYLAGVLALVLHLLNGKPKKLPLNISESTLFRYLHDYRVEIALEEISRKTDFSITPATVETIFTNRRVTSRRSQKNPHETDRS